MINSLHSSHGVKRLLTRSLMTGLVSTVSLLAGWVPTLHLSPNRSPALVFDQAAYAQAVANVSNEEIQSYARSALAIEPIRQAAYDEIKRILGSGQVPPIACHRPNSLNNLNPNIRQIAQRYCNRATQIVGRNNLSINRFNTITVMRQSNAALEQAIQEAIRRIQ
ncbi:MAG: DUF4168 domain-containing protein [Oculatellaceae cyanobacterium bins.114]|nr:DUF4168 domain-containing protein [Oculatellaceae cyanobacterium bins.114]